MPFGVDRTRRDGHELLRVRGELDLATRDALSEAVDQALTEKMSVLYVDLTETRFCDSAGAHALVTATRRARDRGTELYLLCPATNRPVRRILDMLQIDRIVDVTRPADLPRP